VSLLKQCWTCWPKQCKCAPSEDEIEQMKGDIFLLYQELQRENRRAREFAGALRALSIAVWDFREQRMEVDGLDGVPGELFNLGELAKEVAELLNEERNQDRVAALYSKITANNPANTEKP